MTREIKFRCWNKKAKKMLPEVTEIDLYSVEPYILIQYTGLLDKNGKEIYQSDLIEYNGYDGMEGKYLVEWKHGGFWLFNLDGSEPDWEFNPFTSGDGEDMEVIGNEFEGLQSPGEGDIMGIYDKDKKRKANNNK